VRALPCASGDAVTSDAVTSDAVTSGIIALSLPRHHANGVTNGGSSPEAEADSHPPATPLYPAWRAARWSLLTTQGLGNCVSVVEEANGAADRAANKQAEANGGEANARSGAAVSVAMRAPSRFVRVVIPKGSWSPSATLDAGREVGGVAARAAPRLVGSEAGVALTLAVRFPTSFRFAQGGTLPGLWTTGGIRAGLGWRGGGRAHVYCTMGGIKRRAVMEPWYFTAGRWHFIQLVLEAGGRVAAWADDELIGICESPATHLPPPIHTSASTHLPPSAHSPPAPVPVLVHAHAPGADSSRGVAASLGTTAPDTGLLFTLFYGGATEDWAAPADAYVDVGSFVLWHESREGGGRTWE